MRITRSMLRDPNWFRQNLDAVLRAHARGEIVDDIPRPKMPKASVDQRSAVGNRLIIDRPGPAPAEPPAVSTEPAPPPVRAGADFGKSP